MVCVQRLPGLRWSFLQESNRLSSRLDLGELLPLEFILAVWSIVIFQCANQIVSVEILIVIEILMSAIVVIVVIVESLSVWSHILLANGIWVVFNLDRVPSRFIKINGALSGPVF